MEKSASETQREKLVELLREELPVLRAKRRLSQENVAEAIGISRHALVAFFQNDAKTKKLLDQIPDFSDLQFILNKNDS